MTLLRLASVARVNTVKLRGKYACRLTSLKGLVTADFLEEAIELLHILQRNMCILAVRVLKGLLDILEQYRNKLRVSGKREKPVRLALAP